MRKNFPQESSEAFLELRKVCITQNKKKITSVFGKSAFETTSKKDIVLCGFSKKKRFGTLPPLLNRPMGFHNKLQQKQFKDSS